MWWRLVWFLWSFGLCFVFAFVWFSLCLFFPLLPACLSSFTDWCLVHRQQSREQKKNPLAEWLMQHIHYTLVQTSVDWMSRDQHGCGHLLQVDLPRGTWDARALAVALLIFALSTSVGNSDSAWLVGCRAFARNLTLALLDLLHLDDHEFSRQVVARFLSQKNKHRLLVVRHKLRTWY